MSYHGEELDFDFLGTYRDKSTDEDDSDDDDRSEMHIGLASPSFDSSRENHEQDGTSIGVDSFDPPQSPVAQDIEVEGHEDSDGEPSPWRNSKAKKRIIVELKDNTSCIHSMNIKSVHARFAPRYLLRLFKTNFNNLLRHKEASTGPFAAEKQQDQDSDEESRVQPWYSKGNISTGYSLLYNILMEPDGTGIENMTVHALWQSHSAFRCYDFESFQGYHKKMVNLTKKHRKIVLQDEADFEHDMKLISAEESGLKWYEHPAKEFLKEDVANGIASTIQPHELRLTRQEYQQFDVKKFCKEVHHEKQKQRAKPFWQWFRNKEAREMHERQVMELRKSWIHDNEVEKIRNEMERIWNPDT